MRKAFTGARLFAGVSALTIAMAAHAQSTQDPAPGAVPGGTPAATAAPAGAEVPNGAAEATADIVVTGSRTIRNGDASPAPVTVIGTQEVLQVQPGTLADALNLLPVFAGSRNTASNPSSTGSQAGGNGNANQLNLRNLGPIRTLVLLDGNRVPPTTFNNVVDVDIIPQMLISRVDTVTGGVAAVYGSDAVAGVVNYVIDKKFTGLRAEAEAGVSQRGDYKRRQAGVAYGANLLGGHFEASYQYIQNDGIAARSDRPNIFLYGVSGSGTAANPYILAQDVRQSNFTFGGLITSTPANTAGLHRRQSRDVRCEWRAAPVRARPGDRHRLAPNRGRRRLL